MYPSAEWDTFFRNFNLDLIFLQIESGKATLNEKDTTGATPAHYAAGQGNYLRCAQCSVIFCPLHKYIMLLEIS